MQEGQPPTPVDASTILLLRDGTDGRLEVFMVVRHHQIDFASGALVFPGGKSAKGDLEEALKQRCLGADEMSDRERYMRLTGIREVFEESGVLLAKKPGSDAYLSAEEVAPLDRYRPHLDKGDVSLNQFLVDEDLYVDLAALQPFSHWITPDFMPKRFDTHFYLARAPKDQEGLHDGYESVDSVWINPSDALDAAERNERTVIFPTRMNLAQLGESGTTDQAMAAARQRKIVTVLPHIEDRGDKKVLCIPAEAGYPVVEEPLGNPNG